MMMKNTSHWLTPALVSAIYLLGSVAAHCFWNPEGRGGEVAVAGSPDAKAVPQCGYGPFAQVIRTARPMAKASPFRLSTKRHDGESELLYYGYRYYNASTGRWISRDPLEHHTLSQRNPAPRQRRAVIVDYAFCANKPTQSIDTQGLYTEEDRQKVCDDFEKEHPPGHTREDPESVNMSGSVVCKGGIAYPCIFNKDWKSGFRQDVLDCFMAHEKSHADDATAQKRCDTCPLHRSLPELRKAADCHACPPWLARFPKEDYIRSECKAYKALFDCLNKFTKENPRPVGWTTGDWLIEGFLKNHPGKCSKEFPGDTVPWDY
jgi:RHS repeat-associated protein